MSAHLLLRGRHGCGAHVLVLHEMTNNRPRGDGYQGHEGGGSEGERMYSCIITRLCISGSDCCPRPT